MPGWEYCRGDNDLQGRGWDNYDTRELYITLEYSWNTWSCQRGINIESSSTVEAMLCGITRMRLYLSFWWFGRSHPSKSIEWLRCKLRTIRLCSKRRFCAGAGDVYQVLFGGTRTQAFTTEGTDEISWWRSCPCQGMAAVMLALEKDTGWLQQVFNEQRKEMVYNGMDWEVKAEYLRAHNR